MSLRSLALGGGVGLTCGLTGLAFPAGSVESFAVPAAIANIIVLTGLSLG